MEPTTDHVLDTLPVLPLEALRSRGVLWAINRTLFHPRGFALGLAYPDDATLSAIEAHEVEPIGFRLYGDGSEPWKFADRSIASMEGVTVEPAVLERLVDEDEAFRCFEELLEAHRVAS